MDKKLQEALKVVSHEWRHDFQLWWKQESLCPRCLVFVKDRKWYGSKHFYLKCTLHNPYKKRRWSNKNVSQDNNPES